MVKKWDIWYLNLNPVTGSEQRGIRPVLVISNNAVNDNLSVFTCIPFSSIKPGAKVYPTEVRILKNESGLDRDSVLMIQQIRTVSLDRLNGRRVSRILDYEVQCRITNALANYFEI